MFFFPTFILFLSHLKKKNKKTLEPVTHLIICKRGHGRAEKLSVSISYSWPLSHTPEIVLWSSLLCHHREEPSAKWKLNQLPQRTANKSSYTLRLIVPFAKLPLVNKLSWAILQLAEAQATKTNWQHGDSTMEEWSPTARLFQEMQFHILSEHPALFRGTQRLCS